MGQPNALVYAALVAFGILTVAAFSTMPPRRAFVVALLGGWIFLPHYDGQLTILKLHSKIVFVPAVVLLASLALDGARWRALRPQPLDLAVTALCIGPFFTALDNELGSKEAIAAAVDASLTWGAAYALGRAYLGTRRGMDGFARALVGAGLVYVPICLWEIRMSPQLHLSVYGFRTWSFDQALRFGGFRPSAFMQHGLAVGMFMASASLVAYWRWRNAAHEGILRIPVAWAWPILSVTTVLGKSTGAILLLVAGIAVLEGSRMLRTPALLLALALVPTGYATARIAGWNAETVTSLARRIDDERARSIQFRISNENLLIAKAMQRPVLGWGRYGRAFVYDEEGRNVGAVTDGLWIIALGFTGIAGLVSLGVTLLVPPVLLLRRYARALWADRRLASAAALCTVLLLWTVDEILNAMISPVYPAIAGALVSATARAPVSLRRTAPTRPPREEPAHVGENA